MGGVMEYSDKGKNCTHAGYWENNCRHGLGYFTDGESCSFGQYMYNRSFGTHYTWKIDSGNRGGDNEDDSNIGNDVMLNNFDTNNNEDQNEVLMAPLEAIPKIFLKRHRPIRAFRSMRGKYLQKHVARRNKEGTGAKSITEKKNCIPKHLDLLLQYFIGEEQTNHYFYLNHNNIDGRQTRSNGPVRVECDEIYEVLLKQFEDERTPEGYIETGVWRDIMLKVWGVESKYLSNDRDLGTSKPALLGKREPILITLKLATKKNHGGDGIFNRRHAMLLLPYNDGTSELIDAEGESFTLDDTVVKKYMNWKPGKFPYKKTLTEEAKAIFETCLGKEFSSRDLQAYSMHHTTHNI